MSVCLWNYSEDCEGNICVGNCDNCPRAKEEDDEEEDSKAKADV